MAGCVRPTVSWPGQTSELCVLQECVSPVSTCNGKTFSKVEIPSNLASEFFTVALILKSFRVTIILECFPSDNSAAPNWRRRKEKSANFYCVFRLKFGLFLIRKKINRLI